MSLVFVRLELQLEIWPDCSSEEGLRSASTLERPNCENSKFTDIKLQVKIRFQMM